jgi:hypothetical protein
VPEVSGFGFETGVRASYVHEDCNIDVPSSALADGTVMTAE